MFYVTCCNGYYLVGSSNNKAEALRMARAHVDGTYVCFISQDGKIIGDAIDGYHSDAPEYYRDAATQTGMYDAW